MAMTQQEKDYFNQFRFKMKGRLFYPAVLKPKAAKNSDGTMGKEKYSALFAWKAEENAEAHQKLGAFLAETKQKYWPTWPMQTWVNPVKKFETFQKQNGQPAAEFLKGYSWVNAATGLAVPPQVFRQGPMGLIQMSAANPDDEIKIYSGCNAVMEFSFYKIPRSDKAGLSTNMNLILILDGGDKVASAGSVDPNAAFAGFLSDMGNGQVSAPTTNSSGTTSPSNNPQWDTPPALPTFV